MPAFDPKAYEEKVLKPLRRSMPNLPDDLVARYAVEPDMDDAAVQARVKAVVSVWNKHALKTGSPIGIVAQTLLRDHEQRLAAGEALLTAGYWTAQSATRERRLGPVVAEVADRLTEMYGPLGVVTASQLTAAAAGHTALAEADVERARDRAGLRRVEPVELPTSGPVRGRAETLELALTKAGVRSVAQLLYPGMTSFGLLGGFTVVADGGTRRPDPAAVAACGQELEKRPDSPQIRAQKEAVGLLVTETRAGADLTQMALFHLLGPVRANRALGSPRVLYDMLSGTGLVESDAAMLAVSVFAEAGSTPVRDPAQVVSELLAEGRLVAAEQAAAALPGEAGDAARQSVARQRSTVDDLRRKAGHELREGREDEAARLLAQALGLATDLPGLAEEAAAVPAVPVLAVAAGPDGMGVRISWRPSPEHGPDTEYRVVRGSGREPADPDDGTVVALGESGTAADPGPPVGRPVHYAVFVRRPGGRWSRPCGTATRVVPPVVGLVVEGGDEVVTGRWNAHPDVVTVEVRRSDQSAAGGDGEPIVVERNRGFRDTSVVDGVRYRYSVVACYRAPDGTPLRSEPVVELGASRVAANPVKSLQVTPEIGPGLALRLSWQTLPGSDVVVRRSDTPCPWDYQDTVPLDRMRSWGSELRGEPSERGRSTVLVAPVPSGRSYCVAFTVGTDDAVRGDDKVVDVTEPVRRIQAQRFGDDVRVTWTWPDAVGAAEVAWPGGRRRISVTQYRNEGGCLLRGVPGVRRVEVGALVLGGTGDETRAPAVSVEVDDRPPRLGYELRMTGNRMFGGVRCTVTFSTDEPVPELSVVLVGVAGRVMPLAPTPDTEIRTFPVAVRPGAPVVVPEIPVPSYLRKPYWLRCFLVDQNMALLVDPPVSQMKVS